MLAPDLVDEITDRHRRARLAISRRLSFVAAQAWDALGSWDEVDVDRLAEALAPSAEVAKAAIVTRATGFYSAVLEVRAPAILPAALATTLDYRMPFTSTWHALAEGRPFDEALSAGRSTAEAQADRFLTTTSRQVGDLVAERTGRRVRWRRVPEPKACRWCLLVATQTYRTAESADFGHDRCNCDPVPMPVDRSDPFRGRFADRDLLAELKADGTSRRLTDARARSRQREQAAAASRRADANRDAARTESDPQRRQRLLSRAREWDRKASEYLAGAV